MKTLLLASLFLLLFTLPATAGDREHPWDVLVIDKDPKGTNIRKSPAGEILKVLPFQKGGAPRRATLSEQSGGWFKVEAGGVMGWMHGSMLGTCASATEDGAPSLCKSPRNDSPVGVKVPAEAPVQLLDMREHWLHVRYVDAKGGKHDGWLPEQALAAAQREMDACAKTWAAR